MDFRPSWLEVEIPLLSKLDRSGILTSNQLGRKSVFYSRQVVGKLILEILSNLGRIIFCIFHWSGYKNAFLGGYHWESFFLCALPKTPIPSATTWRNILKNCRQSTHKKFGSLGYHLRRTMDKMPFSPATTWGINDHPFKLLPIN